MTDMPIVSDIFRLSSRRPCYAGCVSAEVLGEEAWGRVLQLERLEELEIQ